MSHISTRLFVLCGLFAIVAGILGVAHAPEGLPKAFWGAIAVLGVASIIYAGISRRKTS